MTLKWVPRHRAVPVSPRDALASVPGRAFAAQTLRQIVHLHQGGQALRLHLCNQFGQEALEVGELRVALHNGNGRIDPATDTAVTVGNKTSWQLPAGHSTVSDPVELPVAADCELAVSLYVPTASAAAAGHPEALQTSYVTAGNLTAAVEVSQPEEIGSLYWVTGVDALAPNGGEPVVAAFGDSLTDGTGTTNGANRRYPDHLSRRLSASVLNLGISGNRLLRDGFGTAGISRFRRDVLDLSGVTHVIIELGTNDIGLATMHDLPQPGPDEIIAGLTFLARIARAAGVIPIGATLPPTGGTRLLGFYSDEGEAIRVAVNDWARSTSEFHAVLDIDRAVRDPDRTSFYGSDFDSGDHLHPNDNGAAAIAEAIDLDVFSSEQRSGVVG
jgi:lysophospholipase L1-like esterase